MRKIEHSTYIVTEGKNDICFVQAIAQSAGIGDFSVGKPSDSEISDGWQFIGRHLHDVKGSSYWDTIRAIGVVMDNDDDPDLAEAHGMAAFRSIGYSVVPPALLEADGKRFGLYMLPGPGVKGALEALLLDAIYDEHQHLRACLDAFEVCTGTTKWAANDRAKMRVEAVVASHCEDNPQAGLRNIWTSKSNPIPRNSPRFEGLRDFLLALR